MNKQHIWFKVFRLKVAGDAEIAKLAFATIKFDEAWAFVERLESDGERCSFQISVETLQNSFEYEIHRTGNF